MELWQEMLRQSVDSGKDLVERFGFDKQLAERLNKLFHIRINPYYLSLIRYPGDPIWLQCIPDGKELEEDGLPEDPLAEDSHSPVPSIVHRYPDRVLFLTTSQCSMYCRFCTRKRKVGDSSKINMKYIQGGIDYIAAHPEIRDVILSGGDPLMLTDFMLERIISGLRAIPHVEIIRLGTKMPCVLPQRITPKLCKMLEEVPSDLRQHALQPSVGVHAGGEAGLRDARRCRHSGGQPGGAHEGGERRSRRDAGADAQAAGDARASVLPLPGGHHQGSEPLPHAGERRAGHHGQAPRAHLRAGDPAFRHRCPRRRGQDPAPAPVRPRAEREPDHPPELQVRHLHATRMWKRNRRIPTPTVERKYTRKKARTKTDLRAGQDEV